MASAGGLQLISTPEPMNEFSTKRRSTLLAVSYSALLLRCEDIYTDCNAVMCWYYRALQTGLYFSIRTT